MNEVLKKYLPERAVLPCFELIQQTQVHLKIVNERVTRHGDYRRMSDGRHQITVNATLNKYRFLITLIHEIAHLVAFEKYGRRIKPHGLEWKHTFQHLMLPFLRPDIYPEKILTYLATYLKNPIASTDSDVNLSLALRNGIAQKGKTFIFEVPNGYTFQYKNILYKRGVKRRTRFECLNLTNKKVYLFNQNAEVLLID